MEPVILLLGIVLAVGLYRFAVAPHDRRYRELASEGDEPAFAEEIVGHPFDEEQLRRLDGLVDRVGLVVMRDLEPGRAEPDVRVHLFVIDINGAMHDVDNDGIRHASLTAYGLADAWGVPIDDPHGKLMPRGHLE